MSNQPLRVLVVDDSRMVRRVIRTELEEGGYEGVGAMLYYGQPGAWEENVEELVVSEVHRQLESEPDRGEERDSQRSRDL